jgi:hypothetical protein
MQQCIRARLQCNRARLGLLGNVRRQSDWIANLRFMVKRSGLSMDAGLGADCALESLLNLNHVVFSNMVSITEGHEQCVPGLGSLHKDDTTVKATFERQILYAEHMCVKYLQGQYKHD